MRPWSSTGRSARSPRRTRDCSPKSSRASSREQISNEDVPQLGEALGEIAQILLNVDESPPSGDPTVGQEVAEAAGTGAPRPCKEHTALAWCKALLPAFLAGARPFRFV